MCDLDKLEVIVNNEEIFLRLDEVLWPSLQMRSLRILIKKPLVFPGEEIIPVVTNTVF